MNKIAISVGIITSSPFVYWDVFIYREPVWFTLAILLLSLSCFLIFIVPSLIINSVKLKTKFYASVYHLLVSAWLSFCVSVCVLSPIFGYIGNHIFPYNIEIFARQIPTSIRQAEIQNQMPLRKDIKLYLINNSKQQFPVTPSNGALVILLKKYSLFEVECKQDVFYVKDMHWELCVQ